MTYATLENRVTAIEREILIEKTDRPTRVYWMLEGEPLPEVDHDGFALIFEFTDKVD